MIAFCVKSTPGETQAEIMNAYVDREETAETMREQGTVVCHQTHLPPIPATTARIVIAVRVITKGVGDELEVGRATKAASRAVPVAHRRCRVNVQTPSPIPSAFKLKS